ncbi:MAG: PLP-dependent aminotransferase family protein [Solirubrobacteraceae bacterium]
MDGVSARLAGVEGSAVREILKLTERPEVLSMAGGLPAPELFDAERLAAAFAAVLAEPGLRGALQYSVTEGDPGLRAQLAALCQARGLDTQADQVLVTTGSQQALDLAVTGLTDPGDVVIVERPCYLAAVQLFRLSGLRIVSAKTDADGLDPDAVRAAVREHGAKLIYTVPAFQNPTGVTLTAERRAALARIAEEEGCWIVEDDPYGELRYRGTASAPIAAMGGERVAYVSSLSKVVAPGLRVGWLVAPPALRAALVVAKQARDLHTSTVDQRAAAHYLASGRLPAHLDGVRREYGARLDALLDVLPAALPDGSRWTTPEGGMFVWVTLPEHLDAGALLADAVAEGVAYVPGAPFYADAPAANTLRLSFVTLREEEIREGMARLARVLRIEPGVPVRG